MIFSRCVKISCCPPLTIQCQSVSQSVSQSARRRNSLLLSFNETNNKISPPETLPPLAATRLETSNA
ncbi:hypothetical protein ACMBCN_00880 [Candidatus Liberibacter asiaticus]